MSLLSIPDINVWLAIVLADHVHRESAKKWWQQDSSDVLAFVRLTQMGFLRLLTTAAAMNSQPLSMSEAWATYDRLFTDERVAFLDEPRGLEMSFRRHTHQGPPPPRGGGGGPAGVLALGPPEGGIGWGGGNDAQASPKLWADAWLLAFADLSEAVIVTFDRALARRRPHSILLG